MLLCDLYLSPDLESVFICLELIKRANIYRNQYILLLLQIL